MSLRCRGAPAAGVIFFIAFLLTNYFQPIFSDGCTGEHCPNLPQRTCSPAQARLNVRVGLVTSEQTTFEWDPLRCINANDRFHYYYAVLRHRNSRRDVERHTFYGISSSSVTFQNLLPCTTYDFSLRTVKSVPLEFPNSQSAITTAAKVIRAWVSRKSIRSLTVAWNVDPQCQSTSIEYTLTYELTPQEGCLGSYHVEPNVINIPPSYRTSYEITGLQPFTTYAISISITGGADEELSITGTTAPTAPPRLNVTVGLVMSMKIIFNWIPLTCNTVNGDFEFYSATLWNYNMQIGQPQIFSDMAVSSVNYTSLDPCTNYTLYLDADNGGGRVSTTVLSAQTKAKVLNAQVSQRWGKSLQVAWNLDAQCQGTTINYKLTYQLTRHEGCPKSYIVELNLNTITSIHGNSYRITNLQPFATYGISISITGGADEEVSLTGRTKPTDPVGVAYLHHDERNSIELKFDWWNPSCADLYGYFQCYNYKLIRGNGSDAEIMDRGDCTQDHQKIYMMDDLQACTLYRFEVQVVTMTEQERRTSEWESVEALTPTRAPGVPRNISISQGSRSVSDATVNWEAPTDSPCEPERYIVTHELLYQDMCETPSGGTIDSNNVDRRTMHNTIERLFSYSQYTICVQGRNAEYDGEPACVNITTAQKAPSKPPEKVECSDQSYGSLTFTWNKPRCGDRNGPISHYEYILNARESNVSILGSINGNENGGDITFTNLIPATMYVFRVRANNDNLSGSYGPAVEAHTSLPRGSSISIVVGGAVGAVLVIVVVIVLIIIFYKRRSNS